jgi:hypothetical protein
VLRKTDLAGQPHEETFYRYTQMRYRRGIDSSEPFWITDAPQYIESGVRLVADKAGISILCLRGFALQSIATPGFTGVINSDSVTPDASRRRGLDVQIEPVLERARLAIRPHVSSGLSALGEQGFSANRIDLLSWCCHSYGPDAVADSTFRFIQVVESDGSSRYLSAGEFTALVSPMTSVFLGLNVGPNGLLKIWHSRHDESSTSNLGICFVGSEIALRYLSTDETKTGTLNDLWPERRNAALFSLFLTSLEKSWGLQPESLAGQPGWAHKSNEMSGYLRRI